MFRRAQVLTGTKEQEQDVKWAAWQGVGDRNPVGAHVSSLGLNPLNPRDGRWGAGQVTWGKGCDGFRNIICNSRPCMGLSKRYIAF